MHTRIHTHAQTHKHTHTQTHTYARTNTHIRTHKHTHVHTHTHVIHTQTHTDTHIYTHTNTHTWLKVLADAEHNPVPTDAQMRSMASMGTGAITAPDSVVKTTNAIYNSNHIHDISLTNNSQVHSQCIHHNKHNGW